MYKILITATVTDGNGGLRISTQVLEFSRPEEAETAYVNVRAMGHQYVEYTAHKLY